MQKLMSRYGATESRGRLQRSRCSLDCTREEGELVSCSSESRTSMLVKGGPGDAPEARGKGVPRVNLGS